MNRLSISGCARVCGVFAMLAAWFALSNHCALLAMQHAPQAEKQCCHTSSSGSHEGPSSSEGVCCKSLRALPLDSGAKLIEASAAHELFAVALSAWCDAAFSAHSPAVSVHTTGPPTVLSFAEVVLQRSVLSHAPPFVA